MSFRSAALIVILQISMFALLALIGCAGAPTAPFPLADGELPILETAEGVRYVQTPDRFFEGLPDWPFEVRYLTIDGLRQAYVDEGPRDGEVVLLLHGQPSWSYLYRRMIPALAGAGYRVIAMDHIGMGRSDKPIDPDYHSYLNHCRRLEAFIVGLGLEDITAFFQDWGSLIGLYVVGLHPEWFARVVVGDGALPEFGAGSVPYPRPADPQAARKRFYRTVLSIPWRQPAFYDKDGKLTKLIAGRQGDGTAYFADWILFARDDERFRPSLILEAMTYFPLDGAVKAAYDAPFPARIAMAGPRSFPGLATTLGGITAKSWEGLRAFKKPFLTVWAANDPGQLGRPETQQVLIDQVPGAKGMTHVRLPQASHFLQDDQGPKIAELMIEFMKANPLPK